MLHDGNGIQTWFWPVRLIFFNLYFRLLRHECTAGEHTLRCYFRLSRP